MSQRLARATLPARRYDSLMRPGGLKGWGVTRPKTTMCLADNTGQVLPDSDSCLRVQSLILDLDCPIHLLGISLTAGCTQENLSAPDDRLLTKQRH